MGRVTNDAKQHVHQLIEKLGKAKEEAARQGFGWMNPDSVDDDQFGHIRVSHVFAIVVIRDLRNNTYLKYFVESESDKHAEFKIKGLLKTLYPQGAPFDAKIIIYLKRSPCTACAPLLIAEFNSILDEWSSGKFIYFSIVFTDYYITGDNAWPDLGRAREYYWSINENATVVANSDYSDVRRVLTVRQFGKTKRKEDGTLNPWHRSTDPSRQ